jgi:vacuolar-type H+-ATPase subunit I/STV1
MRHYNTTQKTSSEDRGSIIKKWGNKLLFTAISVKLWGLIAGTWLSTWLLLNNHIKDSHWLTFNTTIWALIFGMKEIFRISERKDIKQSQGNPEEENIYTYNFRYDNIKDNTQEKDVNKEVVGVNPD